MDNDVLRKLQMTEYEMLKDVAAFCDANDIKYFLIAGTLLGAVRHGGFIPWDDDIDIGMDLKNYKKFLKLAPKGLPDKYFVQHFTTDSKVSIPWIKVRINGTTSMEPDLTNFDIHFGICMDVFLINGISENRFRKKLQIKYSKRQREMLRKHLYIARKHEEYSPKYVRNLPESIRIMKVKLYELIINCNLSKTKYCYTTFFEDVGEKYCFESDWFKTLKRVCFENEQFFVPRKAEKYLKARYGNWRTPPAETDRTGHGDIIIDFENNYTMYQNGR